MLALLFSTIFSAVAAPEIDIQTVLVASFSAKDSAAEKTAAEIPDILLKHIKK